MDKKEIKKGWNHFLDCLNLGQSPLDAEAIRFMNEFSIWLNKKE